MKLLVVLVCLAVAVTSAPPGGKNLNPVKQLATRAPRSEDVAPPAAKEQEAAAIRALPAVTHSDKRDENGFEVFFETAEGTRVEEHGRLVDGVNGTRVLIVEGSSSYVAPDGRRYTTRYSAGLDGVKVFGDHLPQAPEAAPAQ